MNTTIQLVAASVLLLSAGSAPPDDDTPSDIRNSIVKVLATQHPPDIDRPWTKHPSQEVSGSGMVIEGNRILTSAHIVLYTSHVAIEPYPSGDKLTARVAGLAPSIDLAILKLEDEEFFKDRTPLRIEPSLPALQDTVSVYGYPIGGGGMSVTKGIVSRIDFTEPQSFPAPFPVPLDTYWEPCLRIQIDAALNGGNSGGPALVNDRVVGVVQGSLTGAQRIGYLVANQEIAAFLKEIGDGSYYAGKLRIFDEWQPLGNRALRARLGIGKETTGVIVRVPWSTVAGYPLKEWDVITRIGEYQIDNAGMVRIDENLRLRFDYLVSQVAQENSVPLTIVREGRTTEIGLPVGRQRKSLLRSLAGKYPSYFIYGPLVFSTATSEYVDASGPIWWAVWSHLDSPLMTRRKDEVAFDGEELVVVAAQLPHRITEGYTSRYTQVVTHVNNVRIRDLGHLVETLRDTEKRYVVFHFAGKQLETLVFDRQEVLAVTEEILADNGVRKQGSEDALKIWQAGKR